MATVIKPTVGRMVYFYPDPDLDVRMNCTPGEPLTAIVCKVLGDRRVNLHVFDANGVSHAGVTSITLMQDGDPKVEGRRCEWMQYQVGQAKAAAQAAIPTPPAAPIPAPAPAPAPVPVPPAPIAESAPIPPSRP